MANNYIVLDAPINNVMCTKPKYKKKKEYVCRDTPKTVSSKKVCLKCEHKFTSKKGYRLCETCRSQNNTLGDFGSYGFKSLVGRVYA